MKIQTILMFLFFLLTLQTFAQTRDGDPPGKLPGPNNDHEEDLLFTILGSKIYDADKSCSRKTDRKILDKNFWASYSTLLAFLQQKDENLQPKNSSCDQNCKTTPDKVDVYFKCLLSKNAIKQDMQNIIEIMDQTKKDKDKNKFELELKEFFVKLIKISES